MATFAGYGQLKKQNLDDLMSGTRDQVRSQDELKEFKRSALDFALWKRAGGRGSGLGEPVGSRPAGLAPRVLPPHRIKNVLGETIDIHGGGEDLVFPHHENEIAQSEALHGKPLARYLAAQQLRADRCDEDVQVSRQLQDNPGPAQDILAGYHPASPAANSLPQPDRVHRRQLNGGQPRDAAIDPGGRLGRPGRSAGVGLRPHRGGRADFAEDVLRAVTTRSSRRRWDSDFNTPPRRSPCCCSTSPDRIFQETAASRRHSYIGALNKLAGALGLTLEDFSHKVADDTAAGVIELLLEIRAAARAKKDFATSDLIRDRLTGLGLKVSDAAGGKATWELA